MPRFLAIALVLLAAGTAQAAEKRVDRTFTVSPGGTLTVDADGASVKVTGSDGNQVVVHMLVKGSDDNLEKTLVDATQSGDSVTVLLKKKGKQGWTWWGNWNTDEEIEVTVPRQYAIDVKTGGGSVELRNTVGAAVLRTSGGSVAVANIVGSVEARTSGGTIHADSVRGDVDANTSGGDIKLLQVDGAIRGRTSGGSVRVGLVGANRGINVSTSGGGIELSLPKGTTGNLDARTSGGNVSSDIPVTSTEWGDSKLIGTINGGGAEIFAHTSGGSISLRVN